MNRATRKLGTLMQASLPTVPTWEQSSALRRQLQALVLGLLRMGS